jgi:hypothetical protein
MENGSDSPVSPPDSGSEPPAASSDGDGASIPEPQDELDELWAHVEGRWDDPKAHDLFVQACLERRRLDVAAGRYKTAVASASLSAVADKRLQSVVFLATQALQEDRSPPPTTSRTWMVVVAAIVCAGSIAVFLYALAR